MRQSPRHVAVAVCLFAFLLSVLAALGSAAPALAQPADNGDRATSFEAVEGPPKEDVPGGPLLIGAYAFVLVLLIGYVARIGALQAKTTRELERLTRALDQPGRGPKE